MNLAKCKLWGPGIQRADEAEPRYPDELPLDHPGREVPVIPYGGDRGITALGVPIDAPPGFAAPHESNGAPECQLKWREAVGQTDLLLKRLRAYPESQVRLIMLRYCLDACRVVHLLRTTQYE